MARKFKGKTPEQRKKEIDELTDKFSEQVDNYFTSEETLREHLQFMSKFHNYSARNMTLIDEQFKGAKAVGSFKFWKDHGVSVNKGEKGIKILAPTPVNYYNKDGEWKPTKYANKEDKQKIKNGDYETRKKMFFKVGHVFEYTQTNAKEQGFETSKLFQNYHRDGTIENDQAIKRGLEKVANHLDVAIMDKPLTELGTAKGVSYPSLQAVALNERNTDYENVGVLIHELAHAKLHTPETRENFTQNEREFQAEMTAYVVADHYNIDTSDFSLSYLKGWTKNADMQDKEQLLNDVKGTAHEFINIIDKELDQEYYHKQENEQEQEQQAELKYNESHENDLAFHKPLEENNHNEQLSKLETENQKLKADNITLQHDFNKSNEEKQSLSQNNQKLEKQVNLLLENNKNLSNDMEKMKSFVKNNPVVLDEFAKEHASEVKKEHQENEQEEQQEEEPTQETKQETDKGIER